MGSLQTHGRPHNPTKEFVMTAYHPSSDRYTPAGTDLQLNRIGYSLLYLVYLYLSYRYARNRPSGRRLHVAG